MNVVFGATGHTGQVVASTLLDRGAKVRVVARSPEKVAALAARGAQVVKGDLTDATSLPSALEGATSVYLLMPPDMTSQDLIARNKQITDGFAAALKQKPAKHVVLLSSVGAQHAEGVGPVRTVHYAEQVLKGMVPSTFVRASYFMENHFNSLHPMKADGILPVFGGGEGHPFDQVATRDIGQVAAEAMLSTPPTGSQVIELAGPKTYSFNDVAALASQVLGRPVKTVVLPMDQLVPTYTKFGISANVAGLFREMMEGFGKGLMQPEPGHKQARGKTTLEEVLVPALKA